MSDSWFPYEPRSSAPRSCRGGRRRVVPLTLEDALNPAYLFTVVDGMRRHNGQAPGIDRVRLADVSRGEWGQAFRDLTAAVRAGTYRPQPTRPVDRPKKGGGKRTLNLPTSADRVMAKYLAGAFTRLGERAFRHSSYAFRPDRDRFDLHADLLARAELAGLRVVTADDITRAFDRVPVAAAATALARLGAEPALASLAAVILHGHDTGRSVGIGQGCPLSPVALNALLHFALDEPLAALHSDGDGTTNYRYADNVFHQTATAAEGRERLERTRELLAAAGLELKGQPGVPRDLDRGESVDVLGLTLTTADGGRPRYDVAGDSWAGLETKLADAHHAPHPAETARQLVRGWVAAQTPALGRPDDGVTIDRVLGLLAATDLAYAFPRHRVAALVAAAGERWADRLNTARRQPGGRTDRGAPTTEGVHTRHNRPAHATAGSPAPTTTGGTHTDPGLPAPPHTGTLGPTNRHTHPTRDTGTQDDRDHPQAVATPESNETGTGGENTPDRTVTSPTSTRGRNRTTDDSRPSGRSTAPSDRFAVPCGAPPSNTLLPSPTRHPRTHAAPEVRPRPPPVRRGRAPPARSPRPPRPP